MRHRLERRSNAGTAAPGRGHRHLVAALVVLGMTLISCGGSASSTTTTSTTTAAPGTTTAAPTTTTAAPTTTTTAAPSTTTTTEPPPAAEALQVTTEGDFGTHIVDGAGRSLYLFLSDAQATSTCTGGCATTWPPFTAEASAGPGVDAALLGTMTRDDGGTQVTYNGWPLYHYSGDVDPGDALGQGLGSAWFLVDPEGNPVGQAS